MVRPVNTKQLQHRLQFTPIDNQRLAELCGQCDQHLRQIEQTLNVSIYNRGHQFQIVGEATAMVVARKVLHNLYLETQRTAVLTSAMVHQFLQMAQTAASGNAPGQEEFALHTPRGPLWPLNSNQYRYLKNILNFDINFGIGPAGTGKTYLAVACAISILEKGQASRILLVRPAVEAGERLGFLPGDFSQKLDPYFRPLYDALYEMLGFERVGQLIEKHVIEVAPLAYMRGRTLNDACVILDEAQNTTKEQMKMFLTRIGFNSKAIINGDITQTDLPRACESGLRHCLTILQDVKAISFTYFDARDVVRHALVQTILQAYEQHET